MIFSLKLYDVSRDKPLILYVIKTLMNQVENILNPCNQPLCLFRSLSLSWSLFPSVGSYWLPLHRRHHDPAAARGLDPPSGPARRGLFPHQGRPLDQLGGGPEGVCIHVKGTPILPPSLMLIPHQKLRIHICVSVCVYLLLRGKHIPYAFLYVILHVYPKLCLVFIVCYFGHLSCNMLHLIV